MGFGFRGLGFQAPTSWVPALDYVIIEHYFAKKELKRPSFFTEIFNEFVRMNNKRDENEFFVI